MVKLLKRKTKLKKTITMIMITIKTTIIIIIIITMTTITIIIIIMKTEKIKLLEEKNDKVNKEYNKYKAEKEKLIIKNYLLSI